MVSTRRSSFTVPSLPTAHARTGGGGGGSGSGRPPRSKPSHSALPPRPPKASSSSNNKTPSPAAPSSSNFLHNIDLEGCSDLLSLPDPPSPPKHRRLSGALKDLSNSSNSSIRGRRSSKHRQSLSHIPLFSPEEQKIEVDFTIGTDDFSGGGHKRRRSLSHIPSSAESSPSSRDNEASLDFAWETEKRLSSSLNKKARSHEPHALGAAAEKHETSISKREQRQSLNVARSTAGPIQLANDRSLPVLDRAPEESKKKNNDVSRNELSLEPWDFSGAFASENVRKPDSTIPKRKRSQSLCDTRASGDTLLPTESKVENDIRFNPRLLDTANEERVNRLPYQSSLGGFDTDGKVNQTLADKEPDTSGKTRREIESIHKSVSKRREKRGMSFCVAREHGESSLILHRDPSPDLKQDKTISKKNANSNEQSASEYVNSTRVEKPDPSLEETRQTPELILDLFGATDFDHMSGIEEIVTKRDKKRSQSFYTPRENEERGVELAIGKESNGQIANSLLRAPSQSETFGKLKSIDSAVEKRRGRRQSFNVYEADDHTMDLSGAVGFALADVRPTETSKKRASYSNHRRSFSVPLPSGAESQVGPSVPNDRKEAEELKKTVLAANESAGQRRKQRQSISHSDGDKPAAQENAKRQKHSGSALALPESDIEPEAEQFGKSESSDENDADEVEETTTTARLPSAKRRKQRQSILLPCDAKPSERNEVTAYFENLVKFGSKIQKQKEVSQEEAKVDDREEDEMTKIRNLVRAYTLLPVSERGFSGEAQNIENLTGYPLASRNVTLGGNTPHEIFKHRSSLLGELEPVVRHMENTKNAEMALYEEMTGCRVEKGRKSRFRYFHKESNKRVSAHEYEKVYMEQMKIISHDNSLKIKQFLRKYDKQIWREDGESETEAAIHLEETGSTMNGVVHTDEDDDMDISTSPTDLDPDEGSQSEARVEIVAPRAPTPKQVLLPLPDRDEVCTDPDVAAAHRQLWSTIDAALQTYSCTVLAIKAAYEIAAESEETS